MRLIMLDTETTGLSTIRGHRLIEIGAIEVNDSGHEIQSFHHYINPVRSIPAEVVRIHGIDDAMVQDKPEFAEIADAFLSFIEGATLVIHNAQFDLLFLEHELALCERGGISHMTVIDTLKIARKRFPHQKNTLNALCDRYGINRAHRQLHGALLDAQLLGEVYFSGLGQSNELG